MYESYWGMNGRPFEQPCAAAAYYPSELHQSSILQLRYALDHNRHALLIGETGIGKSLILRRLAEGPSLSGALAVEVKHTQLPVEELAHRLAIDTSAACQAVSVDASEPDNASLSSALASLEDSVEAATAGGHSISILFDDVHLMDGEDRWRFLRTLMDMTEVDARVTVLLAGQTSLLSNINRRRDIEQRLSVKNLLRPFSLEQTMGYIHHRLAAVGVNHELFADTAVERLHILAAGIPRQINRLADLCLVVGFADGVQLIDPIRVDGVAQQLLMPQAA